VTPDHSFSLSENELVKGLNGRETIKANETETKNLHNIPPPS
jgi:hypothetical protein